MSDRSSDRLRTVPWLSILLATWLALGLSLQGQVAPGIPFPTPSFEETLTQERAGLAQEIAGAQQTLDAAIAAGHSDVSLFQTSLDLLNKIDLVTERRLSERRKGQELSQEKAGVDGEISQLRSAGLPDKPPYAMDLLDGALDQRNDEVGKAQGADFALSMAQGNLSQAQASFDEKDRVQKQVRSEAGMGPEPADASSLAIQVRVADIEARLAKGALDLADIELRNRQIQKEILELRITLYSERVQAIDKKTVFAQPDLDRKLEEIDKKERGVRKDLEAAKLSLTYQEGRLLSARGRSDSAGGQDPVLSAEAEAWRLGRECKDKEVTLLTRKLERLDGMRQAWERRFRVRRSKEKRDLLMSWRSDAEKSMVQLRQEEGLLVMGLSDLRKELAGQAERQGSGAASPPEAARWAAEQQKKLQRLIALNEEDMASIDAAKRLDEKLLSEINERLGSATARDHIKAAWSKVLKVWQFELTSVDDKPITVSKIVCGLALFLLSFWFSRKLSEFIGQRLLPRMGVNASAAAAFKTLIFYVFLCTFTLMALHIVNVPLTMFTILGSAMAIGVGFGSQTILSNFIAGLILLVERPIGIGDAIQLQDIVGKIIHIGARSTRILTSANSVIIVPNSAFLDKSVINWSQSDPRIKTFIQVGVAYDTPVERVEPLLLKALEGHPGVLDIPAPMVLFTNFGENALLFELHFGIVFGTHMDRKAVESEVRHNIHRLFKEAGIVMPFPQRDIHLHEERSCDDRE